MVYLICFCRKHKKAFFRSTLIGVSLVSVFYSIFFIALGKTQSEYTWDHLIPYSLNGGKDIDLADLQECRSDFTSPWTTPACSGKSPPSRPFTAWCPAL